MLCDVLKQRPMSSGGQIVNKLMMMIQRLAGKLQVTNEVEKNLRAPQIFFFFKIFSKIMSLISSSFIILF